MTSFQAVPFTPSNISIARVNSIFAVGSKIIGGPSIFARRRARRFEEF
jgi:hypothetical protein